MGVTAPAGERRWLQINSELVPAAQATERAVVTSFVDITQRKRNDEILAEAIEAIPDGFVVYDELDRLLICNSAYRRTYALSAPAMVPGVSFEGLIRYGVECGQYPQAGTTAECREAWIAARMDARLPRGGRAARRTDLFASVGADAGGDGRLLQGIHQGLSDGGARGLGFHR